MPPFDRICRAITLLGVSFVVLTAPWFFGAWEQWWFWPFVAAIFLGTLGFAGTMIASSWADRAKGGTHARSLKMLGVLAFLPFLIYAFVRCLQAEVFMDAERSLLLHLTAWLLAIQILFVFSRKQAHLLFQLLLADLCLLGLYGLINHELTGSRLVLWCEGYPQYQGRLTGTYYCPDHFAGVMELAFCLCLAPLLSRGLGWRWRVWPGLLASIALVAVVLSKSRGGGLTILTVLATALVWGFSQWPIRIRWCLRVIVACLGMLALLLFVHFANDYMTRFKAYFGWDQAQGESLEDLRRAVVTRLDAVDRVQMAAAALRAWKTAPVFGIGPGMHQNLWRHFAASADGDRQAHKWPTHPNDTYHSYEVHNDWVQLLEEYGLVGFALFAVSAAIVFGVFLRDLRAQSRTLAAHGWQARGDEPHAFVLAGLLAMVCMGFHSLGDFNLQIPATTWILAAILGVAGAHVGEEAVMAGAPPSGGDEP